MQNGMTAREKRLNRLKSKVCRAKCEQMVVNAMKIELQMKIIKDHIEKPITLMCSGSLTQTHSPNYEVARRVASVKFIACAAIRFER